MPGRWCTRILSSGLWLKDTIWFNGRNDIIFNEGERVPVRYQKSDPADAKLNVFLESAATL
jgi:hypothetical protein